MFRQKYQTFLCVCLLLMNYVSTDECPYKECECEGSDIICQDLELTAIPQLVGGGTGFSTLLMDSNNLTRIPTGSLPSGLSTITLSFNPITTIDDTAFEGLGTTLTSLRFSHAGFSRIPDAFLFLESLQYLSIGETTIVDWNENVLKKIGSTITNLDLKNVGLTNWPSWIQYFPNLFALSLDDTSISSVPDHALDMLNTSLTGLSIANGSLTSVPRTIANLVALISLNLPSNQISNLTWLPQSNKLSILSLNDNSLSDAKVLSNSLRSYVSSLFSLDITTNKLTAIPDLSFLKEIKIIYLSHNLISDSMSGALPPGITDLDLTFNSLPLIPPVWASLMSVESLLLDHNSIHDIRGTDFYPKVRYAELGFNLIRELTNTSFPLNFGIVVLNLNNNPITQISIGAFNNLHALLHLNLQNTKLTRMPLAIASLVNLNNLDMSNCFQLICTCMEKALEKTITSISLVDGQCGQVDIQEFFSTLSPSCPS